MLISSLLVFLREVLPVFFLCAMLAPLFTREAVRSRVIGSGLGLGLLLYLCLLFFLDRLSESMEGMGMEILFFSVSCVQVVLFGAALATTCNWRERPLVLCLSLLLALLTMSSLVEFLTFFNSLWPQRHIRQPLVLGSIVGAGISASLSILLYFGLYWLRSFLPLVLLVLPALFISGRMAHAINLLAQVGLLDSDRAWSTQHWLSDHLAVAHILTSFVGYEATPIAWQVYGYLACLAVFLMIILARRQRLTSALVQGEEQY